MARSFASVAQGSAADIAAAVKAARAAFPKMAISYAASAGALFVRHRAARCQKTFPSPLPVLETMDNGKPDSPKPADLDIPLVARHFYYHAGWPNFCRQEFPDYAACGSGGTDYSVELSLTHAGRGKIGARARDG